MIKPLKHQKICANFRSKAPFVEAVSFGDEGGVVMTAWFVADRGGGGVDPFIRSRARESEEPLHSGNISNFKLQNLLYGRVAKPFYSSMFEATESMEVSE